MKSNTKVSKQMLKMQRIAGLLTEGEYQDSSYDEMMELDGQEDDGNVDMESQIRGQQLPANHVGGKPSITLKIQGIDPRSNRVTYVYKKNRMSPDSYGDIPIEDIKNALETGGDLRLPQEAGYSIGNYGVNAVFGKVFGNQ